MSVPVYNPVKERDLRARSYHDFRPCVHIDCHSHRMHSNAAYRRCDLPACSIENDHNGRSIPSDWQRVKPILRLFLNTEWTEGTNRKAFDIDRSS